MRALNVGVEQNAMPGVDDAVPEFYVLDLRTVVPRGIEAAE